MSIGNYSRPLQLLSVCVISLSISSCASLGKKDCLTGDWVSVGKSDGSKGEIAGDRIAAHTKACSKHGVAFDEGVYILGHAEGLKSFCTTENGYDVGSEFAASYRQDSYNNVCPENLKMGFLEGYVGGLKSSLDSLHRELELEQQELESQRSAFLILKALNSSKADRLEEEMEETEESVSDKKSTLDEAVKEIDKWLLIEPGLEKLLQ